MTSINLVDLFTNLLFPAAVSAYLLAVVTRKLEEIRLTLVRQNAYMALMLQKMGLPEAAVNIIEGKEP